MHAFARMGILKSDVVSSLKRTLYDAVREAPASAVMRVREEFPHKWDFSGRVRNRAGMTTRRTTRPTAIQSPIPELSLGDRDGRTISAARSDDSSNTTIR